MLPGCVMELREPRVATRNEGTHSELFGEPNRVSVSRRGSSGFASPEGNVGEEQPRNTGANTVDEIRRGPRNFVAPCHENLSGPIEFRGAATKFVPSGSLVFGPILENVVSALATPPVNTVDGSPKVPLAMVVRLSI